MMAEKRMGTFLGGSSVGMDLALRSAMDGWEAWKGESFVVVVLCWVW